MTFKGIYLTLLCLILMNLGEVYGQDSSIPTQKEGNKAAQWKGLVIDQSTPEDAIRILGKPDQETNTRIAGTFFMGAWISTGRKEEKVYTLIYKNIKDFKRVTLQFESNKLVAIDLWFGNTLKLTPAQIAANYEIELFPVLAIVANLSPDQFIQQHKQRIEQGIITPVNYPIAYNLLGLTSQTFIICGAGTGVLNDPRGSTISFPGTASGVTLLSRTLEKKQKEVDALK